MEQNEENEKKEGEKDYVILPEDYPNCDMSFKLIVIGNSSK